MKLVSVLLLVITGCSGATVIEDPATYDAGDFSIPYHDASGSNNSNSPTGTKNSADSGTQNNSSTGYDAGGVINSDAGNTSNAAWSSCFDPTEAYPTGVLKYPDCQTYCNSVSKQCATDCPTGNLTNGFGGAVGKSNVLVWCNLSPGVCDDISKFPDYITYCDPDSVQTDVCVEAAHLVDYTTVNNVEIGSCSKIFGSWWGTGDSTVGQGTSCPGTSTNGPFVLPARSAQCCCE